MSATDELRRLLDERGVKWEPSVFDPQHETFYSTENGVGFIVTEFPDIGRVSLACDMRITPEQAVEATLGREKCRFETVKQFIDKRRSRADMCECDRCGYRCARGFILDESFKFCPNCGRTVVYE